MAQVDTSSIAYQLKRVYGDKITDLFARQTMTYNQFDQTNRKSSYRPGGVGYYFAARSADAEGIGARAENAYLPEPLPGAGYQGVISPKLIYGALRLSGLAMESGKSNVESFANVQGDAIANLYKSIVVDLNRQCWGDGTGLLGTLSTTSDTLSTSTTWTCTFNNDRGVRYMRKGMIVDFYQSTAIDQSACASRISSVNPILGTCEMEAVAAAGAGGSAYQAYHPISAARTYTIVASTVADGSYMVRYGARLAAHAATTTYEMTGLDGLYDDYTVLTTFEGLTSSTGPEFIANMMDNSSVNRELSIDLMLQAMDMTFARCGRTPDLMRMGLGQRRKYFALLSPDVRYAPGDFLGGYERLRFAQNTQVSMIIDPVAQPNKIYFEPSGTIKKYELTPLGWGGFEPNKMHWRQDYDQASMFLRIYTNLGVEERNALTVLEDLTEPTGSPYRA
jgi:hypothetical protein